MIENKTEKSSLYDGFYRQALNHSQIVCEFLTTLVTVEEVIKKVKTNSLNGTK